MQQPVLTLYTSNPTDGGFRSLATLLSQQQPVQLRDLSELPAPDRARPTRQQLLAQRADVARDLLMCRELCGSYEKYPRLADQAAEMRRQEVKLVAAIAVIDTALSAQEGGLADA